MMLENINSINIILFTSGSVAYEQHSLYYKNKVQILEKFFNS